MVGLAWLKISHAPFRDHYPVTPFVLCTSQPDSCQTCLHSASIGALERVACAKTLLRDTKRATLVQAAPNAKTHRQHNRDFMHCRFMQNLSHLRENAATHNLSIVIFRAPDHLPWQAFSWCLTTALALTDTTAHARLILHTPPNAGLLVVIHLSHNQNPVLIWSTQSLVRN